MWLTDWVASGDGAQTVISSDTASNMSNPVLVLRLTLRGATGKRHSLIVELTPKDLDAVLAKFADVAAVRVGGGHAGRCYCRVLPVAAACRLGLTRGRHTCCR